MTNTALALTEILLKQDVYWSYSGEKLSKTAGIDTYIYTNRFT